MRRQRVAIYARHSTDKQNPTSSADQASACEPMVERLNGEIAGVYTDPEMSGYRRDRPGLLRLFADIRAGKIDAVVCEALDRIARDGEDINWIGKKLRYDHVRLVTATEGEIDEIKLAVAGLLGSMFLTNLQRKTLRGMRAAVLAGRVAGGRAYGYRRVDRVDRVDEGGEPVRGVLEIDEGQAAVVRRIMAEFADGRSSIQIATGLNRDRIPSPRGGEWNASTIRGDPKKFVGILHNPLYRGRIVWGRREWRKDPDSERRERRYRLRDPSEWTTIEVPDLRIVDSSVADAVDAEVIRRSRPEGAPFATAKRSKHLLSGLIKCGRCGANYTIIGRDYYRCSRNRERGTCDNDVSVRRPVIEEAALDALRKRLLTPAHARTFAEEFAREMDRLTQSRGEREKGIRDRLAELEREIGNLSKNLLAGVVSTTLASMLADREREVAELRTEIATSSDRIVEILPHPALIRLYDERVADICDALNDPVTKAEAMPIIRSLIASVTVTPTEDGAVADVEASSATLIGFATTQNAPGAARRRGRSEQVVAGVRSDRCRTRVPLPSPRRSYRP